MTRDQQKEEEHRRRGGLVLRTLPILLIPIGVTLLTAVLFVTTGLVVPPASGPDDVRALVPLAVIVIFCSSLVLLVRIGRPTISALLLIGAWTLVSTVASLRFGVTTSFPALLIVPICAAGLLLDRLASITLAAMGTILMLTSAWFELGAVWPLRVMADGSPGSEPLLSATFWIGLFWSIAALTALLAGGLQAALRESRAKAAALALLTDELEARVERQTALLLTQERAAATLEERTRLAREIHDTLAQGLAGISVQLGAAQRALALAPERADDHIAIAAGMARESLAEARRSVWNLRSPALERGDLTDALRSIAERPHPDGIAVRFVQNGAVPPVAPEVDSALLRVAQEALANALNHAEATEIVIELVGAPGRVTLTVRDDGCGFGDEVLSQTHRPGPLGGFGLRGMRERLAALDGTLALRNEGGAVVEASCPTIAPRPDPAAIGS